MKGIMARHSNGNGGQKGGSAYDFVKKMALGGFAGFASDAMTEVSRFPYLNDPAPIGGAGMSNIEMVNYGGGLLMAGVGFLDLITGAKLGGISKSMLPIGLGAVLGTKLYEDQGAGLLQIR